MEMKVYENLLYFDSIQLLYILKPKAQTYSLMLSVNKEGNRYWLGTIRVDIVGHINVSFTKKGNIMLKAGVFRCAKLIFRY